MSSELAGARPEIDDLRCVLNAEIQWAGQTFPAGATFRVARTWRRDAQADLLTLDGNDDSAGDWSSDLVLHGVPESQVTYLN